MDRKTGLVSDYLVLFLVHLGVVLAYLGGYLGFATKLSIIIFLVGVVYHRFGLVGGGDVKLLAVIPFFLPIEAIAISIFFIGVAMVSSLYDMIKHGIKYKSRPRFTWVILLGTFLLVLL